VEYVGLPFVNVEVAKSGGTEFAAHRFSILVCAAYIDGIVGKAIRKYMT
jgi:hypothetical protein